MMAKVMTTYLPSQRRTCGLIGILRALSGGPRKIAIISHGKQKILGHRPTMPPAADLIRAAYGRTTAQRAGSLAVRYFQSVHTLEDCQRYLQAALAQASA
jgi:hypothetical protein